MIKFETGKTYLNNYIGDSDLYSYYEITKRTDKTVWFKKSNSNKEPKRVKIYLSDDVEYFYPDGQYSMCMIMKADKFECKHVYKYSDMKMRKLNILEETENGYKLDCSDSLYSGYWDKSEFELTEEKATERAISELQNERDKYTKIVEKIINEINSLIIGVKNK